jgi:hypothetical protein
MVEHFKFIGLQHRNIRRDLLRQPHAEALARHGMAILQSRVTDRRFRDAGPGRDALRGEGGVHPAFLDGQQEVLAGAAGLERGNFLDEEVFGRRADRRAANRVAVRAWKCSVHRRQQVQ